MKATGRVCPPGGGIWQAGWVGVWVAWSQPVVGPGGMLTVSGLERQYLKGSPEGVC